MVGGLDEGIKQKSYMCVYMYKRQPCGDRGKVGGGLVEVGKGGGMGTEGDFGWDNECLIQGADDILLSCTFETCMVCETSYQ